jgi:hypothetical protein
MPEAEVKRDTRAGYHRDLHDALRRLVRDFSPDVILLQETVRYGDAAKPGELITADDVPGCCYDMSAAIDTGSQSHPQKWAKHAQVAQGHLFRAGLWHLVPVAED